MLKNNGIKNTGMMIRFKRILLSKIFLLLVFAPILLPAKTIKVGPNENINSLKKALGIANVNDTVIIKKGIYNEAPLVVTRPIFLLGEDFPVLDGQNKNEILLIKSNNVVVKGIFFKNAGISFIHDNAAVKLDSVSNCVIEGNKFSENFFSIYLSNSSFCKIIGNQITAHSKRETYSGNGIHLWYCNNIIIEKNKISGHRDGIYLEFVSKSKIDNNFSEKNLRYGLHFMFSDSCSYTNNIFQKNGAGVAVMYSRFISMCNNYFQYNWGSASYGLLLKEISDIRVDSNRFNKNTVGIYLEGCSRIKIFHNDFVNNGYAVRLMSNSVNNVFKKNNFIGNAFEVATNSRTNFNEFDYNYWSDYSGYDLNKDGIGDVPYHPVKLFSIIVEKNRPALILLRSFFISILDFAEKIFPTITPETLIDKNPLMKKIV
ncbi:nitrous oxide reductase family maturation protein NosD [Melioribacteraceae bacterium 4301-Me]|uniref:nitrous oxide reductase family maturation protein NosD n=1 Tax=Pyranulibacter aquaticus TaxID=3163344 RepID=UPI0035968E76